MARTKTKTTIFVGIGVLLVTGIITLVLRPGDPEKKALAQGERLIEKQIAKPVDLTRHYNTAVFSSLPSGFHVFNHVPLQIDGMACLWGEGGAERGMVNPMEILDIPLNQRFQTLYVYHKASFRSPPGTPVCEVVLRFADGQSVTNRLLYEDDVLDWFAPGNKNIKDPNHPNSRLAWIGEMTNQNGERQQLRACLTAIENPHPTSTVSSIDLYSCKSRTVAYIMAMTTGPTGLMKDAKPTDDRTK